ncbi:hypothetical protein F5J12DRAFT_907475 [Pisolithus orientalis]|uniref:uncharacterized protein n=1 Tax=Pisolithus orientalis TaxID=936130 RepID=UPI0022255E7E|nr:uncharacterized protein F5J12DRAFT_907475 [Pisolithus orientalis]KAI5991683.1 hypothetical protein F5J12DRAFT_907475 [Pisolithus orientalis]
MRIPPSVLEGCNEFFTAADERCQKASTQFFSDTGVMTLLCCCDCVIHPANMTSAGEKQHYALALIKSLFSHLPDDFHIGLLYDIGFSFAISVFHAFGHQWACQLIYHPWKQEGFGLSDGEGFSGYHQHLFVIDSQVHYLDMKSLTGLGQWLLQCWNHCQEKKASAKMGLRKSGINIQTLQAEWEAQVSVQTKPASHKLPIAECHKKIMHFKQASQRQRASLGIDGFAELSRLQNSSFLQADHLCQQKFELERLEMVLPTRLVSEQKLQIHLSTSYNNLCLQLVALIHQGKAPQGAIAPILIQRDGLFKLDVDDDIWQDIGLEDDSVGLPPAWLADERRCEEEERRLLYERKTLMEWHSEEWRWLEKCRVDAGKRAVVSLNVLR